jgi:hypothetical protein
MAYTSKMRSTIKFGFWAVISAGFFIWVAHLHRNGSFSRWFYYSAASDGYAVNADTFREATPQNPALLSVGDFGQIDGLEAVSVKKGDRLPELANGVISMEELSRGRRVSLEGDRIKVSIPWEIKESKGFKFKDTFKHKGITTYPWAALVNVFLVIGLGVSLGYMAEGLTDLLGIKLEKIRHFEGH